MGGYWMLKVWLLSVVLLFGVVEFYQWLQEVTLPLPLYAIAGVMLAIASNYDKGVRSYFERPTNTVEGELLEDSPALQQSQTQTAQKSQQSISFKISQN
ncbi:MAG: hypothetical protein SAJ12_08680 [Jaaginema sp. PMC 1079.18]|nr:hypothetical protein [Jaaginema sp. PMC 1080.18]MEC4851074.1 hypothetical protein [Jaaginema sp. PMC 1079.18]